MILTSDGDFASLVSYLRERNKLRTVLSPTRTYTSKLLQRAVGSSVTLRYLDDVREKIESDPTETKLLCNTSLWLKSTTPGGRIGREGRLPHLSRPRIPKDIREMLRFESRAVPGYTLKQAVPLCRYRSWSTSRALMLPAAILGTAIMLVTTYNARYQECMRTGEWAGRRCHMKRLIKI